MKLVKYVIDQNTFSFQASEYFALIYQKTCTYSNYVDRDGHYREHYPLTSKQINNNSHGLIFKHPKYSWDTRQELWSWVK